MSNRFNSDAYLNYKYTQEMERIEREKKRGDQEKVNNLYVTFKFFFHCLCLNEKIKPKNWSFLMDNVLIIFQ